MTQGPLLDVTFNGRLPGTTFTTSGSPLSLDVQGEISSVNALQRIEVIVNGEVQQQIVGRSVEQADGSFQTSLQERIELEGSGWVAIRCFESPQDDAPQGKVIFAHTNPVFVDVAGKPLRPRVRDAEFFRDRMRIEIDRNKGLLSETALDEYRDALKIYEGLLQSARAGK